MNNMRPIHPGEVLKDEIETLGLSINRFAMGLHVPPNRITAIVNGDRSITADTALRLAKFFGTSPEFWLNLQVAYDLKVAQNKSGAIINEEIKQVG